VGRVDTLKSYSLFPIVFEKRPSCGKRFKVISNDEKSFMIELSIG
jgi:hypothetical protein